MYMVLLIDFRGEERIGKIRTVDLVLMVGQRCGVSESLSLAYYTFILFLS